VTFSANSDLPVPKSHGQIWGSGVITKEETQNTPRRLTDQRNWLSELALR